MKNQSVAISKIYSKLYAWAHTGWGDSIILAVMCSVWFILGWRFAWALWAAGWR